MKSIFLLVCGLLVAQPATAEEIEHRTESGWFDMENCETCKHLVQDPELLEHVNWKRYKVTTGTMVVTTVDDGWRAALDRANLAMEAIADKMANGQLDPLSVLMCGHCMTLGQLMKSGVKMETVVTDVAAITLITATDPDMVAMIHEFTNRDEREQAEMMAVVYSSGK